MKKVASGTTTVYSFSGTRVIAEYQNGAAPGSPTREYIYSGASLLAKIESGAVQYYHPDQLSVRMMTDSNGNVIGQQGHYPFGESWYQSSTTTKWLFTAGVYPERSRREADAGSGNASFASHVGLRDDYASFRYDVNRLGRFASPDLLAGSIGDPQSLNRYTYVRGDPVNGVDPLGLTDCDPADEEQGYCTPGGESSGDGDPYNPEGGYLEPATGSGPGCTWDAGSASLNCPLPDDPLSGSEAASYLSYLQTVASTMGGYPVGIGGPGGSPGGHLGQNPPDIRPTASDFAPVSVIQALVCPSGQSLDAYLQGEGSPLAGQGGALMGAGSFYNVDPRFIVALAGAETSYGKNITWGQYNAWNWGWNTVQPSNSPFGSWAGGIGAVTAGIAGRRYLEANPPRTTTASIYGTYCSGPGCANGLTNLNNSLTQQGGDPASVQFPQLCKN